MATRTHAATRRRHRRHPHPGRVDASDFDPCCCALDAVVLHRVERLEAMLVATVDGYCDICHRDLCPGHTAFLLTVQGNHTYVICWECGDAIGHHLGFIHPPAQHLAPPYGGGFRPATPPENPPHDAPGSISRPRSS